MKKIGLFFFFTISISIVMGGKHNAYELRKMEIAFQGGLANPIGSFAKSGFSYFDNASGELTYNGAQKGFNYGLSLSFFPSDYFGAVILFNGVSYKFKGSIFTGSTNDTREWTTRYSDKWTSFAAQAGATFRYPLLNRLQIISRASIGYAHLMSPYYKSEVQERRTLWAQEIHSKSAPAFGMGFSVGFKWLISPGFHLNLVGDYFTATPFEFNKIDGTLSAQTTNSSGESTVVEIGKSIYHTTQNFSSLNISLGISFAF